MPNFDEPAQNKDTGHKPPAARTEGHDKPESLLHRLQDEMTQVPVEVAAAAGFLVGLSARLPGKVGLAGKAAATILGTAAAADVVDRSVEGHRDTNTMAYERDAAFITALGSGLVLPSLVRAESSLLEGKKVAQDAAGSIGLHAEKNLFGTENAAVVQSLRINPAAEVPLTTPLSNVIDFGKYAEIYKKGAPKMITEDEIGKFSPGTQAAIRKEIEEMTAKGYNREYLMLAHDGEVMFDPDAAASGEEAKALLRMKKEP